MRSKLNSRDACRRPQPDDTRLRPGSRTCLASPAYAAAARAPRMRCSGPTSPCGAPHDIEYGPAALPRCVSWNGTCVCRSSCPGAAMRAKIGSRRFRTARQGPSPRRYGASSDGRRPSAAGARVRPRGLPPRGPPGPPQRAACRKCARHLRGACREAPRQPGVPCWWAAVSGAPGAAPQLAFRCRLAGVPAEPWAHSRPPASRPGPQVPCRGRRQQRWVGRDARQRVGGGHGGRGGAPGRLQAPTGTAPSHTSWPRPHRRCAWRTSA